MDITMNAVPAIQMQSITKSFPGVKALDCVDFSCEKGEIHALLGENGAGKSTLIKILCGVYSPDEGEILIDGEQVTYRSPHGAQLQGISTIHQELILVPNMSVAENIFLGQEMNHVAGFIDSSRMNKKAVEVLSSIGASLNPAELVATLDSSNQKMVQIAKALVITPQILVVDEPTAPLGAREVDNLFSALLRLKKQGTTIVYISHHLEEIFRLADRLTVLKDGKKVVTKAVKDTKIEDVVRYMIGRELGELFPPRQTRSRSIRTLLEVKNLNRGNVLRDVSFKLQSGEILGIAGLEGNGQAVLLRTVFGSCAKDSGEVIVDGRPRMIADPTHAIASGMALVTDKRAGEGLCLLLSVSDNLSLPTLRKRQKFGIVDREKEKALVERNIGEYRIKTPSPSKQTKFLSGGNQQKIILGKWLNNDPNIVLLMEPTFGVDVGAKSEIYSFIRKLVDEEDRGIVMVTSDMLELLGLCGRILVMYKGRIVKELPHEVATEEKILKAALGVE
jgi:ribose transport system ATP-binding protein